MGKPIMIQGTMSNAGKSLICAGLCRIFQQDGYKVAPFKSQNMALNSFITGEGLEMGRAQVMQAEAAGVEPTVLMNPVLLKPTGDTGSQVIVNGTVVGNMAASEYYAYKPKLRPVVINTYAQLAAQNDIVVIEGAGSPAEINLNASDFVNMGMAEIADAPVLLVGDIDRGGVFASLYGTIALLQENERSRVKGVIVNKFRGDVEILRPGLALLEDLIKVPVLGVVPYLRLDLDDEDSLSDRLTATRGEAGGLDIAVLRLPRISNFTDFNALSRMPSVCLRYTDSPETLGEPDLIIIPGTKNTMGDLLWMRQSGLENAVQRKAAAGTPVVGVCGGYQMLGRSLNDPDCVEQGGELSGMGLLPVHTVFTTEKVRTRVTGTVRELEGLFQPLSGAFVSGYEIHMGQTTPELDVSAAVTLSSGSCDGAVSGSVFGSYLHGLFDDELGGRLISTLLSRKGLNEIPDETVNAAEYKNQQYDALADSLRQSLDMNRIYKILEDGCK